MGEGTGILPGLPAVAGKPVHVGFDGGRLTSDGGILLLGASDATENRADAALQNYGFRRPVNEAG